MEHRHPGSNLLLVHPGSCLLRRLGNHLRKSRTDCVRTRTISWRRKSRRKELKTPHQELERHHQRLERHREEQETSQGEAHFPFTRGRIRCFARGQPFPFDSGRTGFTASRGHQYEVQTKRRGIFRQHPRQESIGGRRPDHGPGFHDLDSPEKELENLRARIRRTLQANADMESIIREYIATKGEGE